MTVQRSRDLVRTGASAASTAGAIDAAQAIELAAGDGHGDDARDAIVLSVRAGMIIKAGLAVRALVLGTLVHVERTLVLGQKTIVLEFGVYR